MRRIPGCKRCCLVRWSICGCNCCIIYGANYRCKQQRGLLTFDDLLLQLEQALTRHPGFAQRLAAQYQAALIDEFQDADPIQYAIFGCIYPPSAAEQPQRVFYVGDPKQAIYGFRGADIHTYLQAAHHAQQRYTLGQKLSFARGFTGGS